MRIMLDPLTLYATKQKQKLQRYQQTQFCTKKLLPKQFLHKSKAAENIIIHFLLFSVVLFLLTR